MYMYEYMNRPDLEFSSIFPTFPGKKNMADISDEEYILRLAAQEKENKWHRFVEGNLILKQGLMDKRKVGSFWTLDEKWRIIPVITL